MVIKTTIVIAAFSLNGFAEHPLIDRLEKEIDYLDSKTAESDSLEHHELGVVLKEFERDAKATIELVEHRK